MNRRDFIKLSALTSGAFIGEYILSGDFHRAHAADVASFSGPVSDMDVKSMDMEVIFDTEIINPPKGNDPVSIWMPVSQSCFEQDVTYMSIDSPVPFHITEDKVYGNKMVHVGPLRLQSGTRITVNYKIHRKTVRLIEEKNMDVNKHLVLSGREELNEDIKNFTDKIVGNEKDPVKIGRKIYDSLMDFLTYDTNTVGCGPGISILMFENRIGRCADFHSLFRSMMVYKGIPVRWEQGIMIPYPSEKIWVGELEGDCIGTHCWTEFFTGDDKWMPVDLVEGKQKVEMRDYCFGTLSPNRFNTTTGRNIILDPPQGGEPLNTFPVTHGEYDGMPLIYGHHYRNNAGYKVLNVEV